MLSSLDHMLFDRSWNSAKAVVSAIDAGLNSRFSNLKLRILQEDLDNISNLLLTEDLN